jgi:hypothetical protein
MIGLIGRAHADSGGVVAVAQDPVSTISQIYDFIRTGRGTAAFGAGLMLVVYALRLIPAMQSRFIGYLLAFGIPTLSYVGLALVSGVEITMSLVLNGLGAGFVAAGGWEALKDSLSRKSIVKKVVGSAAVLGVLSVIILTACPAATNVKNAGLYCLNQDQAKIEALVDQWKPIVFTGHADWDKIYVAAEDAGLSIGTCFVAELVQDYLSAKRSTPTSDGQQARATLEKLRSELGGVVIHTKYGDE